MRAILYPAAITLAAVLGNHTCLAAGNPAAGQRKAAVCSSCHGRQGVSTNPIYPILAGQTAGYLAKSLRDFRSGQRRDPAMNRIAGQLSDTDIEDLAAHFSRLPH